MAFSELDKLSSNTGGSNGSSQTPRHKAHIDISDWVPGMDVLHWIRVIAILVVGVFLIAWAVFDTRAPAPTQPKAYVPEPGSATAEQAQSLEAARARIRVEAPKRQKSERGNSPSTTIRREFESAGLHRTLSGRIYQVDVSRSGYSVIYDYSGAISGRVVATLMGMVLSDTRQFPK